MEELPGSVVRYAVTWVCPAMGVLKYTTLEDLEAKELMRQLSDSALNTTEEIQVFMVWEQKGLKNIIKLDKKICLK
jgi:hypothetical protein